MTRLLVISRSHTVSLSTIADVAESISAIAPSEVASLGQLEDVDAVLVLGNLESAQQAQQLGGVLSLALPAGLNVIVAPGTAASPPEKTLLLQLISEIQLGDADEIRRLQNPQPDFAEFVSVFGLGQTFAHNYPPDLQAFGWLQHGATSYPGAFFVPVMEGGVYYIPFQHVGDHHPMVSALLHAVTRHMDRTSLRLPPFVQSLRLPGEEELDRGIEEATERLQRLQDERGRLREFHGLLGSASSGRFEDLCIRALNAILRGSGYSAEDRPETFDEDFWLVRSGEDYALAEAKGIGSNVRREHVNQVDNHRERHEKGPEDLPGLLIVNIFRNSDELERRQTKIAADVVAAAVRQNVLVLRSWDLHQLLGRALGGEDVAADFLKYMQAGGGWLRVSNEGIELIT